MALAHALTEATNDRQWGVVGQLAVELQARRTARLGVVSLDSKRKGKGSAR